MKTSDDKILIDWTNLEEIYDDYIQVMFIIDRYSDMIFLYFMTTHKIESENFKVLKDFINFLQKYYNLKIKIVRSDGELARKRTLN